VASHDVGVERLDSFDFSFHFVFLLFSFLVLPTFDDHRIIRQGENQNLSDVRASYF